MNKELGIVNRIVHVKHPLWNNALVIEIPCFAEDSEDGIRERAVQILEESVRLIKAHHDKDVIKIFK